MARCNWLVCAGLLTMLAGCPSSVSERNAFLTYTEDFGATSSINDANQSGGGTSAQADTVFRPTMTLTLVNNFTPIFTAPVGDLNVSVAAWVNVGSIRSAEQQDSLISAGYVQLTHEVKIGSVFTLPPGTFVLNGPGLAGAQLMRVESPAAGATTNASMVIMTPDVLLLFKAPPTSCDSPAFTFTDQGFPLDNDTQGEFVPGSTDQIDANTSSTDALGIHTLAQVDVYQCEPLMPGMFLKIGGGVPKTNEFFEGESITVTFRSSPNPDGTYANVVRQ